MWRWFSHSFNLHQPIFIILDCWKALNLDWSHQVHVVINSYLINMFYDIWNARNKTTFDGKVMHWKVCLASIALNVKIYGNHIAKASSSNMVSFCILKKFNIFIYPPKLKKTLEILWQHPTLG